jgi:5'-nucleotidase
MAWIVLFIKVTEMQPSMGRPLLVMRRTAGMAFDLSRFLVIGVTSRALFNLEYENRIFEQQGLEAYSQYQLAHENDILEPGVGYPLVQAILRLNQIAPGKRNTEVVIMSRNNADASLRIYNSIRHYGLDITRCGFTSGASVTPYLRAFNVNLFLSATEADVQAAVDAGVAAALIYDPPRNFNPATDQLRIAFDGDAVLFSEESERIYQDQGLDAFLRHEEQNAQKPLPDGPFAKLLRSLSFLQSEIKQDPSPIRTALVTARNTPAHERVIRTLRVWGVRIDEVFFMGGVPKTAVLEAFGAHMFFDDQHVHLKGAAEVVPAARVPYPSKQTIREMIENKDENSPQGKAA